MGQMAGRENGMGRKGEVGSWMRGFVLWHFGSRGPAHGRRGRIDQYGGLRRSWGRGWGSSLLWGFLLAIVIGVFGAGMPSWAHGHSQTPADEFDKGGAGDIQQFPQSPATQTWSMGLLLNYSSFTSRSITKNGFPLRSGFPIFFTGQAGTAFDVLMKRTSGRTEHRLILEYLFPSNMASDEGSGKETLLNRDGGNHTQATAFYRGLWSLGALGPVRIGGGFDAGLLYEYRMLEFISGRKNITWDLGTGVGPAAGLRYSPLERLSLSLDVSLRFFIPYGGAGHIENHAPDGTIVYEQDFSPFSYGTTVDLAAQWQFAPNWAAQAGFKRRELLALGTMKPFVFSELLAFKADSYNEPYLGVRFNWGGD